MFRRYCFLFSLIALICFMKEGFASCPLKNPEKELAYVSEAIGSWEKTNGIALQKSTETAVIEKFCASADGYNALQTQSKEQILATANVAVPLYLTAMKTLDKPAMSMDAAVGTALGHNGLSRPEMNRLGILAVTYVHSVDLVRLGKDEQAPYAQFFVAPGALHAVGVSQSNEVCSADLTIRPQMTTNWSC
jgi:hypothetical protein